jgi:hypothetical protein
MSDEVEQLDATADDYDREVERKELLPLHPSNARKRKSSTPAIMTAERRARALSLRMSGATYDQVAEAVGYSSASSARRAVMDEIAKLPRETASELRQMQYARLMQMYLVVQPQVMAGDLRAIQTAQGLMRDMNDLMGISPDEIKNDLAGGNTYMVVIEGTENEYVERLKAMAGVDPTVDVATDLELHNAAIPATVVETQLKEEPDDPQAQATTDDPDEVRGADSLQG